MSKLLVMYLIISSILYGCVNKLTHESQRELSIDSNENVIQYGFLNNMKREGKWYTINKNGGDTLSVDEYLDDFLHGVSKSFVKNRLKMLITYKKGDRNGPFISYYDNGNIEVEGNYYNGYCQKGEWLYYYKNGIIESKGNYDCDKQIGIWEYCDTTGVLIKTVDFDSDKLKYSISDSGLINIQIGME